MSHLARWCGLSFALHFAAASVVVVAVSRETRLPIKPLFINLQSLELPELPEPAPKAPLVPVSPKPPEQPVKPPTAPAAQAVTVPVPVAPLPVPASRQDQPKPPAAPKETLQRTSQQAVPETRPVAAEAPPQRQVATSLPSPAAAVRAAGPAAPLAAPAQEARPAPEKARQRYLKEHFTYIRDLITQRLVYPPVARRMNWSGKALVTFVVAEDGSVSGLKVLESSGYPILDKSALDTVRSAAPFPRPPVTAEVVVPVHYQLMR